MNEREAIQFIMNEIKDMRRQDADMYWEMRKNTQDRYENLLNRLRELDEKERALNAKTPIINPEIKEEIKKATPFSETVKEIFKQLPPPKNHFTPEEARVDRVSIDEQKSGRKTLVSYEELTHEVERFLKETGTPVHLGVIKKHVEYKFDVFYTNFSKTMKNIIEVSPYIKVDTSSRRHIYWYEEPKP